MPSIMNKKKNTFKAKPFVKWAGGKGKILSQLDCLLPDDFDSHPSVCYIEPFVGGGAMLFHMLQAHNNIKKVVINDINDDLINAYQIVRDRPKDLLRLLKDMEKKYSSLLTFEERKASYLAIREKYNYDKFSPVERAAYTIFINHTCFNGLYRVNKSGKFNVPWGRYKTIHIVDEDVLMEDSQLLQRVEILKGDYRNTIQMIDSTMYNFFYFDPPYRPLSETSNFNDYQAMKWGDQQQAELKEFCDKIEALGYHFMQSNSDSYDGDVNFFEELYDGYEIDRVIAPRNINAIAVKRSSITELVIRNYVSCSKTS